MPIAKQRPRAIVVRGADLVGAADAPAATAGAIAAGSSADSGSPDLWVVVVAIGAVLLAWGAVLLAGLPRGEPLKLAEGVTAFALFYVAAQAIERALEPVAMLLGKMKYEPAKVERDRKVASLDNNGTAGAADAAAQAQAIVDRHHANRAVGFWAAAAVLGMGAAATMNVLFVRAITTGGGTPAALDLLITGLVISGGTKPLHDLIARVEKGKQNASTPPETKPAS